MSDQTGDATHDEQHPALPAATVDGAKLLDSLERLFGRYLYLPDHAATLVALWVVHTHAINAAGHFPILLARSPEKGCGKTTLLSVLHALVRDPVMFSEASVPSLFRLIHKRRPTILLDEGDMTLPNNRDMLRLLNSGHARGASIWRTESVGGAYEPTEYSTWGPKALAAIGSVLPATTMDRCIVIHLQRKNDGVSLTQFTEEEGSALSIVRERIAEWVRDNEAALKSAAAKTDVPFSNRRADNWRPLLTIADAMGTRWSDRAREAALTLATLQPEAPSESQMLLADMRAYFEQHAASHCPTKKLQAWLVELEDRPWRDYHGQGKWISASRIADILQVYGIAPRKYREGDGGKPVRGYPLDAKLALVFKTYAVEPPERVEQLEQIERVPDVPVVPTRTPPRPGTINFQLGRINP